MLRSLLFLISALMKRNFICAITRTGIEDTLKKCIFWVQIPDGVPLYAGVLELAFKVRLNRTA